MRQENGLETLCNLFEKSDEDKLLEMCALAFRVLLSNVRYFYYCGHFFVKSEDSCR